MKYQTPKYPVENAQPEAKHSFRLQQSAGSHTAANSRFMAKKQKKGYRLLRKKLKNHLRFLNKK